MLIGAGFAFDDATTLQYPDATAIEDAYRSMPKRGCLLLSCHTDELARTLRELEAAGFYGLQINTMGLAIRNVEIRCFKGKQGPCFDSGRSASYQGTAVAALDDDNHLIVGTMRVCEKTAAIYQREPYSELMQISPAEPALFERLDHDPVPFDCDTLEADAARLHQAVGEPEPGERVALLYPGPFKTLVLADGTLLRRGQVAAVPATLATDLQQREGCTSLPEHPQPETEQFQQRYAASGASCLLGALPLADTFSAPVNLRLEALQDCAPETRERLLHLIERDDPQFILTGSDPRVQFGCCPSDAVFEANQLVEAGILMCWRAPTPPDACPTTIYAFAGELAAVDGGPVSTHNRALREQVRQALR